MRIILDTNVLVSGLFPKKSPPTIIVDFIIEGYIEICYSIPILTEYREVLKRPKFKFSKEKVEIILNYIRHEGYLTLSSSIESLKLPDIDDIVFLEAAINGKADYLVTGNTKHFPKKYCKNIKVVTPRNFIEILEKEIF